LSYQDPWARDQGGRTGAIKAKKIDPKQIPRIQSKLDAIMRPIAQQIITDINEGKCIKEVGLLLRHGFNSVGLEKPKQFSKIPRLLGGFKRELFFSWFFVEKSCSNLSTNIEPSRFHRTEKVSNNFSVSCHVSLKLFRYFERVIASKAERQILKIPCVLKYFSKPRRVINGPATGVRTKGQSAGYQNLDPMDRDSESRRSISCGILLFASPAAVQ